MSSLLRSRFSRWAFFWVFIGSLLRFWQLTVPQLWYDEIVTGWFGRLPIPQLVAATQGDVHPPLWYLIEWVMVHIGGETDFSLRLPAVMLSIAALPLLVLIARKLKLSEGAALVGLALMAVSPFELYFAQEARMYALLQFAAMLGAWSLLERRWWLLSLSAVVMMYTHNYGIVYAAMLYAFALIAEIHPFEIPDLLINRPLLPDWVMADYWKSIRTVFISGVVAVACYLPWVPSLLGQFKTMDHWWQQPTTFGAFIEPVHIFLWNASMLGDFYPIAQVVTYTLILFALLRIVQLRSKTALWLAVFLFAPMVFSVATEPFTHPTFLYRTFIGSAPALYLLIGWALTEKVDFPKRLIAGAVLAPLFAMAVIFYYPVTQFKGFTDAPQVLQEIEANWQPGDIIYHMNTGSVVDFYYLRPDQPAVWEYVGPDLPGDVGTLSALTVKSMGLEQTDLDDLPWTRAWLVFSAGPTLGVAEDQLVKKLVSDYDGDEISTFSRQTYTGGLWLLHR